MSICTGTPQPSSATANGKTAIQCQYRCMFGISNRPEGVPDNKSFKCYHRGRSYLTSSGKDGKLYWFAFVKNPDLTIHTSIPRYTTQDEEDLAAEIADDPLFLDITFKDLYNSRMASVLVPLEEFVLKRCFYKRAILIGDSFHKVRSSKFVLLDIANISSDESSSGPGRKLGD